MRKLFLFLGAIALSVPLVFLAGERAQAASIINGNALVSGLVNQVAEKETLLQEARHRHWHRYHRSGRYHRRYRRGRYHRHYHSRRYYRRHYRRRHYHRHYHSRRW